MPFIPMPMPKPVCRTSLNGTSVQCDSCVTFGSKGVGMNITAQLGFLTWNSGCFIAQRTWVLENMSIQSRCNFVSMSVVCLLPACVQPVQQSSKTSGPLLR